VFCSRWAGSDSLVRVASVLRGCSVVGFSGSRSGFGSLRAEVAFFSLLPLLPSGARVVVGCARGVDAAVRGAVPGASVFSVESFAPVGVCRAAFVRRSVAVVRSVVAGGGVLVVFPGSACPVGLVPRPSWSGGFGSGSWSAAALAVGSGGRALVWLPPSVSPPVWLSPLGGGWFFGCLSSQSLSA